MPAVNFHARFANAVQLGCLIGELQAAEPTRPLAAIRAQLETDFPNEFPRTLAPKRQTIRAARADGFSRFKSGDRLFLYTGMRTKQCRKLGDGSCTQVVPIRIAEVGGEPRVFRRLAHVSEPNCWRLVSASDLASVAHLDGFRDGPEMLKFLTKLHRLPFTGHIIRWSTP